MNAVMYILKCAGGFLYTGSTVDLESRLKDHLLGAGANFTRKHLPFQLVYTEEYDRIEDAFKREKQVQNWSRTKKEALIRGDFKELRRLSSCRNTTHYKNNPKLSADKQE